MSCEQILGNGRTCGKDLGGFVDCMDCHMNLCDDCEQYHSAEVCEKIIAQKNAEHAQQQQQQPNQSSAAMLHLLSEIKAGRTPTWEEVAKAKNDLLISNEAWYEFVEAFVKDVYPEKKDQKWSGNASQTKKQRPPELILEVLFMLLQFCRTAKGARGVDPLQISFPPKSGDKSQHSVFLFAGRLAMLKLVAAQKTPRQRGSFSTEYDKSGDVLYKHNPFNPRKEQCGRRMLSAEIGTSVLGSDVVEGLINMRNAFNNEPREMAKIITNLSDEVDKSTHPVCTMQQTLVKFAGESKQYQNYNTQTNHQQDSASSSSNSGQSNPKPATKRISLSDSQMNVHANATKEAAAEAEKRAAAQNRQQQDFMLKALEKSAEVKGKQQMSILKMILESQKQPAPENQHAAKDQAKDGDDDGNGDIQGKVGEKRGGGFLDLTDDNDDQGTSASGKRPRDMLSPPSMDTSGITTTGGSTSYVPAYVSQFVLIDPKEVDPDIIIGKVSAENVEYSIDLYTTLQVLAGTDFSTFLLSIQIAPGKKLKLPNGETLDDLSWIRVARVGNVREVSSLLASSSSSSSYVENSYPPLYLYHPTIPGAKQLKVVKQLDVFGGFPHLNAPTLSPEDFDEI